MKRRRGNREGSIFQRADGRWCGELYLGQKVGGGKKIVCFYGETRAAVQEKLTDAARKHRRNALPDPSTETVEQFLERWLRDSAKHSIRPRTFECYAGSLRTHAIPTLGQKRLTKLGPGDLRALYAAKLTEGLAPRSVQLLHAILHRALKQAARDGLVDRNVAELVDRPRAPRRIMQVLSPAQAAALLEAARGRSAPRSVRAGPDHGGASGRTPGPFLGLRGPRAGGPCRSSSSSSTSGASRHP